jgi:acetyl esterase/lipase
VVVNFHGGGFCLGKATDDARWCATVVSEVEAVVVSVDYRLAPEHAFPTAVEDGADAILYLVMNADSLLIDRDRIAVSGFSSGANMCFTVPLRLQEELTLEAEEGEMRRASVIEARRPPLQKSLTRGRLLVTAKKQISVKAVCAWYPPVDYTRTREQRRATAKRLDQTLPQVFTDLFDESYLQPPTMDMANPYLSPGVAPRHLLSGLPEDIIIFACEWDMLLDETERFKERLVNEIGKTVHYNVVMGVPHGFDKAPNPIRQPPNVMVEYRKACEQLKRLLA